MLELLLREGGAECGEEHRQYGELVVVRQAPRVRVCGSDESSVEQQLNQLELVTVEGVLQAAALRRETVVGDNLLSKLDHVVLDQHDERLSRREVDGQFGDAASDQTHLAVLNYLRRVGNRLHVVSSVAAGAHLWTCIARVLLWLCECLFYGVE